MSAQKKNLGLHCKEKSISTQSAQTDTTNVPETTQKEKEQKKQTFSRKHHVGM